jgi:hypothetical protein
MKATAGDSSNSERAELFPGFPSVAIPLPSYLDARDKWDTFRQSIVTRELVSSVHHNTEKNSPSKENERRKGVKKRR